MKNPEIKVLYEDHDLVIINKPSGMLSIPDRFNAELLNAYTLLKEKYPSIFIVHRIDKETSGILCFAKNAEAHKILNIAFEEGNVEKEYIAICYSTPEINEGVINMPIAHSGKLDGKMVIHSKGKESVTKYKCIESWQKFSLIKLMPLTGRTHQIRIHLAYLQCPIVGERLYHEFKPLTITMLKPFAKINPEQEESLLMNRVALHASKLKFELHGNFIQVEAPMPKDMHATLHQMRKCLKKYNTTFDS